MQVPALTSTRPHQTVDDVADREERPTRLPVRSGLLGSPQTPDPRCALPRLSSAPFPLTNNVVELKCRAMSVADQAADDIGFWAGAERIRLSKLKRTLDLAVSALGLLILAPVFLLIAGLIALETKGSPIWAQSVVGIYRRPFRGYRFRTTGGREEGVSDFRIPLNGNVASATALGSFLRHFGLHELPLLLNVFLGQMSLVGPRPYPPGRDLDYSAISSEYKRFATKPGIIGTSFAADRRDHGVTIDRTGDSLEWDRDYIRRWTFMTDARMILQATSLVASRCRTFGRKSNRSLSKIRRQLARRPRALRALK